jgi:hypothetical protein
MSDSIWRFFQVPGRLVLLESTDEPSAPNDVNHCQPIMVLRACGLDVSSPMMTKLQQTFQESSAL